MKKLATICLALAVGVGSVIAATPAMRKANPAITPQAGNVISENPYAEKTLRSVQTPDVLPGVRSAVVQTASLKPAGKKAPAYAGESGSTIYGDLVYDASSAWTLGLGEVTLDAGYTNIVDFSGIGQGGDFGMAFGYFYNGHYLGIGQETIWGFILLGTYMVDIDLATGDKTVTMVSNDATLLSLAAYSAEDDKVWGFSQNATTGEISFGHLSDASDPMSEFVAVASLTADDFPGGKIGVASTVNQVTNQFIVVSATGQVSEINKTTGQYQEIAELADPSAFLTGICYSPIDGGYVYAVCTQEACSIQLLDENFAVVNNTNYPGIVEYDLLYCPDTEVIDDAAPAESKLVNTVFPNGALSGTITYQLASTTYAGTPVIGNIDWILEIDGAEYKRGSAAAGSQVTIEVKELTEGLHKFTFRASLGGRFGRTLNNSIYIGNDTPVAPEKVELTGNKISWTPVTKGVNKGYVNPKEVTYNVYLNDELIARGISATETATKLDPEKPIEFYVAAVEAVYDRKRSEKTYSNDITYGSALELPQAFAPTEKESRLFTIVDNNGSNGDSGAIHFGTANLGNQLGTFTGFYYVYNGSKPADDYLFLPLMKFTDANAVYEFEAQIFRTDNNYMEKYEIVLATAPTPDAVVKTIRPETEAFLLDSENGSQADGYQANYFTIPAAGDYMIGIHVTSDADQFRLWMNEFVVKAAAGMTTAGPSDVLNLTAVAGDKGALNATVSFTLPTTQINGAGIAADATLTATVQADGCESVSVTGKAGEAKSVVIPTLQGDNEVTVTVANGDLKGIPSKTNVYTGVDVPSIPTNVTVTMSEDNYTAHLTWDAPAVGANGGYVAPTGNTYYLCNYVESIFGGGWQIGDAIGTDVYSFDIEFPVGTAQDFSNFGIIAENVAGMAPNLAIAHAVTGEPYANPTTCNYAAGDNLQPIVNYVSGYTAYLGDPKTRFPQFATDDNLRALYVYASSPVTGGKFSMPKFSTKDCQHAAIELTVYGGSCESFTVSAATYGVEEKEIETFNKSYFTETGVQKVTVELPAEFQNKDWVEPFINFDLATRDESYIMYAFRYFDNIPNDFGVLQLSGANNAKVGEEAQFTAQVMNYGYLDGTEPAAKWTLTRADGTVLADVDVAATSNVVEAEGTYTNTISYTPTADDLGTLKLTYALASGDNKAMNDTKSVDVNVTVGSQPVVTDLHADEITYENVMLGWTAPAAAAGSESFEDEVPFVLAPDEIAGFTTVDGDGAMLYGINSPGFAALDWAYQPMGFMVWSESGMDEIIGSTGLYPAHEGDNYLVAISPSQQEDGTTPDADDWLISPAVNGGSTFSFWAKAFTYAYGAENIEIMYSTTGNKPEDFKVLEYLDIEGPQDATPEWEQYQYTLPQDAKYFAIHYVSHDIFGIAIDDIEYTAAGNDVAIDKYEVYRDGALVGVTADVLFNDTTVEDDTQYSYIVVPVLSDGAKGLDSNTLVLRTTDVKAVADAAHAIYAENGRIIVKGFEGQKVLIATADGKLVANDNASAKTAYNVAAGVYVVKAGKTVVKVIVK